ncbi:DUF411 domain-containing protein [Rhizobium sp. P007]|jgi:hypothetical protein|uniref:DUF411 domain-containing protein n=1 Tax=Rhizobium sp. P007 TaxID=285908 RepID=UPI000ECE70DE|nr:DUF411 domain-containing protein [Rhizobium sp. P007]KAB2693132.1 DUF411 domain-containing protein [Ochrobactrum sp. Kaboul]CAD7054966.1 metal-binding protein [Rhizobium sp. P007]HCJ73195.1 CopG family transcriptional regulator [Agrobacterium sp.]
MIVTRRNMIVLAAAGAAAALSVGGAFAQARLPEMEVARSASCGCCAAWIDHVRSAGFVVRETIREDLDVVKAQAGVPSDLQSCHTATIDGFVIEGHVPAADIQRLLAERPAGVGLAVAGMPAGSPGMEMGGQKDAYDVVLFGNSGRSVFARH